MTPRRPPWRVRLRPHLDSLDRYHAGAALVLMAGILGGLLVMATDSGPPWVGYSLAASLMFAIVTLALPDPD